MTYLAFSIRWNKLNRVLCINCVALAIDPVLVLDIHMHTPGMAFCFMLKAAG